MNSSKVILPPTYTRTMELYPEPYAIKDSEDRYLYGNQAFLKMLRVNSLNTLLGKLNGDVESKLFENEEDVKEWHYQHTSVFLSGKQIDVLEIHPEAIKSPYIARTLPLMLYENQISGTVIFVTKLDVHNFDSFMKAKRSLSLLLNKPDYLLTENECEIVFLKLQRLSTRDISRILSLNKKIVDERLRIIYRKTNANHQDEFEEICKIKQYDRYLPKRFLTQRKISFIKN